MATQNKFLGLIKNLGKSFTREDPKSPDLVSKAAGVLEAIGTKSNITTFDACVTRIRLLVKDSSLIDEAKLKQLGASKIMKLDSNHYQIVVGILADPLVEQMKTLIKNS